MSIDPVDNAHLKTLIVSEAGCEVPVFTHAHAHSLRYSFTDADAGDGFSAWQIEYSSEQTLVEVQRSCAPLDGGYRQQALNRFFAKAILLHRPDCIIVCGIAGCTVDLPRVAALFSVPCIFYATQSQASVLTHDGRTTQWLEDALRKCVGVFYAANVPLAKGDSSNTLLEGVAKSSEGLAPLVASLSPLPPRVASFDYSIYELCSRDHPLLMKMQAPDVRHFEGVSGVLDVGCGAGLFLDLLRERGIEAKGVEKNASIADYGRQMGLDIETADALSYLAQSDSPFGGIYCSHFVEHLPIDAVQELIRLMASRLVENGVLVLVFPDPESIRSQLLGFWRDPEHVRFYHSELIISMATLLGFEVEWTSHYEQPHSVGHFPEKPASIEVPDAAVESAPRSPVRSASLTERVLAKLGLASAGRVSELEARLERMLAYQNTLEAAQIRAFEQLDDRTQRLWEVNQTWAWNDNVTIKLRKRHSAV